jgi:hypothetical protein
MHRQLTRVVAVAVGVALAASACSLMDGKDVATDRKENIAPPQEPQGSALWFTVDAAIENQPNFHFAFTAKNVGMPTIRRGDALTTWGTHVKANGGILTDRMVLFVTIGTDQPKGSAVHDIAIRKDCQDPVNGTLLRLSNEGGAGPVESIWYNLDRRFPRPWNVSPTGETPVNSGEELPDPELYFKKKVINVDAQEAVKVEMNIRGSNQDCRFRFIVQYEHGGKNFEQEIPEPPTSVFPFRLTPSDTDFDSTQEASAELLVG